MLPDGVERAASASDLSSPCGHLAREHFRIGSTFDELELTEDRLARIRLGHALAEQLRAHARLENEVVYLVVRRLGGDAARWVEGARQIHKALDALLEETLANLTIERVAALRAAVTRHIDDEESRIFPLIERLDDASRKELGRWMDELQSEQQAHQALT